MREQLLYYAWKYKGDYHRIKKAIECNEPWGKIEYKGNYVTLLDEDYPIRLKRLKYPPWVLFYKGDLTLVNQKMIAVIGSRNESVYGHCCTKMLIKHINEEYGIVSGVAKGIDGLAHYYAIKENRRTIGVIGCGLDIVYPKENESLYEEIGKHHLLLSEYPYGCKPLAFHFPWRNRIIASLCEKVVVIEAKVKSGTMITVNEALELGISVYAFPHNINNINGEGCNMLIEQGCSMINCIRDMNDI